MQNKFKVNKHGNDVHSYLSGGFTNNLEQTHFNNMVFPLLTLSM